MVNIDPARKDQLSVNKNGMTGAVRMNANPAKQSFHA